MSSVPPLRPTLPPLSLSLPSSTTPAGGAAVRPLPAALSARIADAARIAIETPWTVLDARVRDAATASAAPRAVMPAPPAAAPAPVSVPMPVPPSVAPSFSASGPAAALAAIGRPMPNPGAASAAPLSASQPPLAPGSGLPVTAYAGGQTVPLSVAAVAVAAATARAPGRPSAATPAAAASARVAAIPLPALAALSALPAADPVTLPVLAALRQPVGALPAATLDPSPDGSAGHAPARALPLRATMAAGTVEDGAREAVPRTLTALIAGLSGERETRIQLTALRLAPAVEHEATALPSAGARSAAVEVSAQRLALPLQGLWRGSDGAALAMHLNLVLERQLGAPVPAATAGMPAPAATPVPAALATGAPLDAATQALLLGTFDTLAAEPLTLELPTPAAALAGQALRFQMLVDPQGLWPLQGLLVSGLLVFGRLPAPVGDDPALDAEADAEADAESEPERDADPEADPGAGSAPPDTDQGPDATAAPASAFGSASTRSAAAEVPDDGGPPIISAGQWLDLELAHWRREIRRWMWQVPAA